MQVARVEQKKQLRALEASKVNESDVMLHSVNKEVDEDAEEEEWDSERFKRQVKKTDEAKMKQLKEEERDREAQKLREIEVKRTEVNKMQ
jgi:DNA excision repair protein ERCC-6